MAILTPLIMILPVSLQTASGSACFLGSTFLLWVIFVPLTDGRNKGKTTSYDEFSTTTIGSNETKRHAWRMQPYSTGSTSGN